MNGHVPPKFIAGDVIVWKECLYEVLARGKYLYFVNDLNGDPEDINEVTEEIEYIDERFTKKRLMFEVEKDYIRPHDGKVAHVTLANDSIAAGESMDGRPWVALQGDRSNWSEFKCGEMATTQQDYMGL